MEERDIRTLIARSDESHIRLLSDFKSQISNSVRRGAGDVTFSVKPQGPHLRSRLLGLGFAARFYRSVL